MKELNLRQKETVVKLFLQGYTYDDICQKVGIGKGSAISIIDDFREGGILPTPDVTEYIDELRRLAVDLKKQNSNVAEVKTLLRLQGKIKDTGVEGQEVENWLEICRKIASDMVSNSQFIKAALELARLTSQRGCSYEWLLQDCEDKLEELQKLEEKIKQKTEAYDKLKTEYDQEKQRANNELNSITDAMSTAKDTFTDQKRQLKIQLKEYRAQHKLSWEKVNLVIALMNNKLHETNLTQAEIDKLGNDITEAGSLTIAIKELKGEKEKLQSEVKKLNEEKDLYQNSIKNFERLNESACNRLYQKIEEERALNQDIQSKKTELDELKVKIVRIKHDIQTSGLILNCLRSPQTLKDFEFDRLVNIMIALRRLRSGKDGIIVKDDQGKILCQCEIPYLFTLFPGDEINIDFARGMLANYLLPLVKDQYVHKYDYQTALLEKRAAEEKAQKHQRELDKLTQLIQRRVDNEAQSYINAIRISKLLS